MELLGPNRPELEGTVIFLASKASDFVYGQTIYFDQNRTV